MVSETLLTGFRLRQQVGLALDMYGSVNKDLTQKDGWKRQTVEKNGNAQSRAVFS